MPKLKKKIHIILTGGTIDSYYDSTKDTVVANKKSIIPEYIKRLRIKGVKFTQVCAKDSRDIRENDLKKVLKLIQKSKDKRIIITHGTYTMPDTGRFLKSHLSNNDKVIILTGAMLPLKEFASSDAGFNLGYAMAQAEHLKSGIYVCMQGVTFAPDEIAKMISQGEFISILSKENIS
ncbi:asparaginase [Candidatus Parcubacteria bacterium]|jgi:L-asparaginase|nr:asparaginase [Candidatus Parcubacteria bacterium]MBT3949069.1 asparaginase [Candidatus Parcubacteria bacterium]